jgi:hypothetical protein
MGEMQELEKAEALWITFSSISSTDMTSEVLACSLISLTYA